MKRYCSTCGTPNSPTSQTCSKCNKPMSAGLKTRSYIPDEDEEVVIVKKNSAKAKRIRYVDEYGNDLGEEYQNVETPKLSFADITIERPQKITIASLKNGAHINLGSRSESLPEGVEVTSRSYFHQENLD